MRMSKVYKRKLDNFRNKDVKSKLNIIFKVMISSLFTLGVWALATTITLNMNAQKQINVIDRVDKLVSNCRVYVDSSARLTRELIVLDNIQVIDEYRKNIDYNMNMCLSAIETIKEIDIVPDDVIMQFENGIILWEDINKDILNFLSNNDIESATNKIIMYCNSMLQSLENSTDLISSYVQKETLKAERGNHNIVNITVVVTTFLLASTTILSIIIRNITVKCISEPVVKIEKAVEDLSNGNLNTRVEYECSDELGVLSSKLDDTISTITNYISDISSILKSFESGDFTTQSDDTWKGDFDIIKTSLEQFENSMNGLICDIKIIVEEVLDGTSQISESSIELANGTQTQATQVGILFDNVDEVSKQLYASANIAKDCSNKVSSANNIITMSNEKMNELLVAMNNIRDISNRINTIIDSINNIADETNLLALNASIEASRAGDAGKGFAVVADRVSILAMQSTEAVSQSTKLIKDTVNAIENSVFIASETDTKLKEVVITFKEIESIISNASNGLEEQANSFKDIISSVETIHSIVEENSVISEECASANQEIGLQVERLNSLVDRFKVK